MYNLEIVDYKNELANELLRQKKLDEFKIRLNEENRIKTEEFIKMCDEEVVLYNEDFSFCKSFYSSKELFSYLRNNFRRVKYEFVDSEKCYLYIDDDSYFISEI